MKLRIHRTDGKTGQYSQSDPRKAEVLLKRLHPQTIFSTGPIVIGVFNPFSIVNTDDICWIEVETTDLETPKVLPNGVEKIQRLSGREEYEEVLQRQWPKWREHQRSAQGDLLEALVELAFRNGEALYLHVTGHVATTPLTETIFGVPAITAVVDPHITLYINPKCIVRARVYHSKSEVDYPYGLWFAEADDI